MYYFDYICNLSILVLNINWILRHPEIRIENENGFSIVITHKLVTSINNKMFVWKYY